MTRRIAGATRDADDATQEALIKIVRALPQFDGRSAFGTWAYRIATNSALDELRKRKRRPALTLVTDDEDRPDLEPVDDLAHRSVDSIADRLAIDAALDALDDDFRAAVVLRDIADLDYAEIAEVLDVPVGTVKSRIARGRKALAKQLRLEEHPDLVGEAATRISRRNGNQPDPDERPTDLT